MSTIAASAAASGDKEAYDPSKDPRRKPKSNDPGWQYGYWTIIGNRDLVTCTLCGKVTKGGITRLKEHLVGKYSDVTMCPRTTREIIDVMEAALKKNKRARPIFLEEDDLGGNQEGATDDSQAAVKKPSTGTAAKRRNSAFQFKAPAAPLSKGKVKGKEKSIATMFRKTPEEIVDERLSGQFQSTLELSTKTKEERHYVNIQWALWFYECGIPFNAVTSRQFQIACEATAQYGSGYKPPSNHEIREPLLNDCVKMTSSMRADYEISWKSYGCTLMSDGWTDRRGRHLINFLVNTPDGTYFMESADASSEKHDANMLADLLQKRIEDIGKENVVQIVTDNGANYKAAGAVLMQRFPTLYWTPCAAHSLDLMLEEIASLKQFKKTIARARRVTTFIYRHGRLLSYMRKKTGGKDLVRPATTRFATAFLTLKSMYKHRDALKGLFVSESWTSIKLARTEAGKNVADIVISNEFWNSVEDCLRASGPLLIVLRVVDGDEKPAMPEVAALMHEAKEKIKLSFCTQNKQSLLKKILGIIDRRSVKQMDHPLYGAALYLNPGKFFPILRSGDDAKVGELRGRFTDVLARMVEDDEIRSKIDRQAIEYEDDRGDAFSSKMAKENKGKMRPIDWWRAYGGQAIDLQRFAKRIVSLCASSSGCERNWSTFEFIHTKRRNRLQHKRLNAVVFISYNRKMKTRFELRRKKSGKNYDPLVMEEFNWDNEWVDSLHEPPQGTRGCEVPWEVVDEAMGASRSLQGRNLPRNASRQINRCNLTYQRRPRVEAMDDQDMDQHEQVDSDNEDEEEDPYDDADVSDHDEAPNGTENGGENIDTSVNNLNEFDDGYDC